MIIFRNGICIFSSPNTNAVMRALWTNTVSGTRFRNDCHYESNGTNDEPWDSDPDHSYFYWRVRSKNQQTCLCFLELFGQVLLFFHHCLQPGVFASLQIVWQNILAQNFIRPELFIPAIFSI